MKIEQKCICKLCGYEAKNITALTTHLQYKHKDYNTQRYYDEFYKKPNEGFCEVCGKETKFRDMVKGYNKHCCKSCAHKTKHFRDSYNEAISNKSKKELQAWKNKVRDRIRAQSSTGRCITDGEALKRKNKSIKRLKMIVEKCDCTFVDYSMDSRFYKPTDYNPKTNRSAQETWDRDNEKIRRCAEKGLTLIRIKEYDWLTDKELIKQQLLEQFK